MWIPWARADAGLVSAPMLSYCPWDGQLQDRAAALAPPLQLSTPASMVRCHGWPSFIYNETASKEAGKNFSASLVHLSPRYFYLLFYTK